MKKQINPSIKAHLLPTLFILLSLLAIAVIPFAQAQRHQPEQAQTDETQGIHGTHQFANRPTPSLSIKCLNP